MEDVSTARAATMRSANPVGVCPHVNLDDPRCDSRLSINRLDQAFGVCFGAYHTCPMYRSISQELLDANADMDSPPLPMISITANGRHVALRPTGS